MFWISRRDLWLSWEQMCIQYEPELYFMSYERAVMGCMRSSYKRRKSLQHVAKSEIHTLGVLAVGV